MSSIAYVADEQMIAYHRLYGNRDINFWRLSTHTDFTDFQRGDLLFFYCRPRHARRKGIVGYAHFAASGTMSLNAMWKKYGKRNGYESLEQMRAAIQRADRHHRIPRKLGCLELTDAVFFRGPVAPKEVGITIPSQLESFIYLDQQDANTTVRLLRKAAEIGIDDWSAAQTRESEEIFRRDELYYQLALIGRGLNPLLVSKSEEERADQLLKKKLREEAGWRRVQGGREAYRLEAGKLVILEPFAPSTRTVDSSFQQLLGRMSAWKLGLAQNEVHAGGIVFRLLTSTPLPEKEEALRLFNTL